jgi:hypothetical protein
MCRLADTQLRAGAAWVFYGRFALRSASHQRDSTGLRPEPAADRTKWARRPRATNSLRHCDYGPADPRGISTGPPLGRIPGQGHPPHVSPGCATLRGSGLEQRWRTRNWAEAGGPSGAMGHDPAVEALRTFIVMLTLHGLGADQYCQHWHQHISKSHYASSDKIRMGALLISSDLPQIM